MKIKLPFIVQDDSSKYKVIATENEKLKDELIDQLKSRIIELETIVDLLRSGETFREAQGFSIPKDWNKQRPRIRTATELSMLMEEKSRHKLGESKGAKSAEEVENSVPG